jgi:hypothetical protein
MGNVVDINKYKINKAKEFVDQEYVEFIKLLQYFLEVAEPKYQIVNVYISAVGQHIIRDESQNIINHEIEFDSDYMNYDDYLVSSLIHFNPQTINIYYINDLKSEIKDTLSQVFGNRIIFK